MTAKVDARALVDCILEPEIVRLIEGLAIDAARRDHARALAGEPEGWHRSPARKRLDRAKLSCRPSAEPAEPSAKG
jgi:hypothetical protein